MSDQKICPTCGTEYPLSERFCPRDGTALRSANAQADLLGSIIADRYHIIRKLGEGGMGTVYLAEHVKMGRKSALKVMNPGMNTDPDAIARFNREAANAARLSHPNICGIYDFGETSDGLIYLAMEFIEGSSLTSLIEKTGALPAARCGSIIHQVADALQVAHDAGIVHRDLKPDNIMVAKARDGSDLVKVVDFGIAKASSSDAQKVTKTGLVVGTPEYMSPEQLAGDKLDGRSDIYSLGLVAFNCLTGKLPFPAETVQEAMIMRLTDRPRTLAETQPGVSWPAELQRTLDMALERDAADRYQGAAQFGREFAAAISAMPATRAMEEGTMIVGAASAPAAGGAVPPTRVRQSAATAQMDALAAKPAGRGAAAPAAAPAVERRKSNMPAMAGGATLLVAATVAAVIYLKQPAADAGTGGVTTPPVVDSSRLAAGDTSGAGTAGAPQSTQSPQRTDGGAADPGAQPGGTKVPVQPMSNPNAPAVTPVPAGTNSTTPGLSAADSAEEVEGAELRGQLAPLVESFEKFTATEQTARRAVLQMRRLRTIRRTAGRLTPREAADSWFVEMSALHMLDEDDAAICRAAARVLAMNPNDYRRSAANAAQQGRDCTP